MELVSLYPYDPTARATSNRIENESITVIPPTQITDYSYVIPRAAPYFAETLVVKDGKTPGARTLVENVDYWCVIDFLSASVGLGKRIAVGIALLDPSYSGTLYVSYQTLGGNYTIADYSVLEELIRERYIVKHVSYEQLINLPEGFSPEWHQHEVGDMVGMTPVVSSLEGIRQATAGRNGSYDQLNQQLLNHVGSAAAHTPTNVGLGNVRNYTVATLTEAKAGTQSRYITADILKQYVEFSKQDVSGYLTKSTADSTYAAKSELGSYYTKTTTDGRYAIKTDTYTKNEIDSMINSATSNGSFDNYYTKNESDASYAKKTDLNSYITTSTADGRYATKTTLASYYNKVDSDNRYAGVGASYTKSESDSKYATRVNLNSYLTESESDSRYQQKTSMSSYYTKIELDKAALSSSTFKANIGGADYELRLNQKMPNGSTTYLDVPLNLTNHAKKSDVYTQTQIDDMVNSVANPKIYQRQWISTTTYRSYQLSTSWTLRYCLATATLSISIVVNTAFYYDEDTILTFNSGLAPNQSSGTSAVVLTVFGFDSADAQSHRASDTWVRQEGFELSINASGNFDVSIRFSHGHSDDNKYIRKLRTLVTCGIDSTAKHNAVMQLFKSDNLINIVK